MSFDEFSFKISDLEFNDVLNTFLELLKKEHPGDGEKINVLLENISHQLLQEESELLKFISLYFLDTLLHNENCDKDKLIEKLKNTGFMQRIAHKFELKSDCLYYIFGTLYRYGSDEFKVHFDLKKSVGLFKIGALENNIESIRALGIIYHTGEEKQVEIDRLEAYFWYKKGEELNDAVCLNNLGLLTLEYLSFENIEKAKDYFARAADLGLLRAKENLLVISD